jgi:hypothetical protein
MAMPEGGNDDCHHCDFCLEDEPMTNCSNYDGTKKLKGIHILGLQSR